MKRKLFTKIWKILVSLFLALLTITGIFATWFVLETNRISKRFQ